MTSYAVHSFHININTGDAAIHLRVIPTPSGTAEWSIERAVLMDGGKNSAFSVLQTQRTLDYIEANYTMVEKPQEKPCRLRFDSFVITHWDNDHYGGIFELIRLTSQVVDNGTQRSQCFWMKYNATDPFLPETVLYVPYWKDPDPNFQQTDYKNIQKTMYIVPDGDFTKTDVDIYPSVTQPVTPLTGAPANMQFLSIHQGGSLKLRNPLRGLCRVCATADELIGRDLFDHSLPSSGNSSTWISLADYQALVVAHARNSNGIPGLYCIGADRKQITKPTTDASSGSGAGGLGVHSNILRVTDPPTGQPLNDAATISSSIPEKAVKAEKVGKRGGHVISVRSLQAIDPKFVRGTTNSHIMETAEVRSTDYAELSKRNLMGTEKFRSLGQEKLVNVEHSVTNRSSIMCIVACNTGLLHYMAGDAEFVREQAAAKWLASSIQIPVMKLSHHGASYSTPTELLDALTPRYIISPSGTSARFGHPRPEVLLYLKAFYNKVRANLGTTDPPIYTTNYPYYFVANAVPQFSLDALKIADFGVELDLTQAATDEEDRFRKALRSLHPRTVEKGSENTYDDLAVINKGNWTVGNSKRYIVSLLETAWAEMSPITSAQSLLAAKTRMQPVGSDQIFFVKVMLVGSSTGNTIDIQAVTVGQKSIGNKKYTQKTAPATPASGIITSSPTSDLPAPTSSSSSSSSSSSAVSSVSSRIYIGPPGLDASPTIYIQPEDSIFRDGSDEDIITKEEADLLEQLQTKFNQLDASSGNAAQLKLNELAAAEAMIQLRDENGLRAFKNVLDKYIASISKAQAFGSNGGHSTGGGGGSQSIEDAHQTPKLRASPVAERPATKLALHHMGDMSVPVFPTDGTVLLVGERWGAQTLSPNMILVSPAEISHFVSFFHNGTLATTSGLSVGGVSVHSQDPWFHRLSSNGIGVSQINAFGQADTIQSFSMDVSFDNVQMVFTSQQTNFSLGLTPNPEDATSVGRGPALGATGIVPDSTCLILGLIPGSSLQCMLSELLMYIRSPFALLFAMDPKADFKLNIDPAWGQRGAIWYDPSVQDSSTIRLQMNLDPSSASTASTFLSNVLGMLGTITLNNMTVVASKTSTVTSSSETDDLVRTRSSLILSTDISITHKAFTLALTAHLQFKDDSMTATLHFGSGTANGGSAATGTIPGLKTGTPVTGLDLKNVISWLGDTVGISEDLTSWLPSALNLSLNEIQVTVRQDPGAGSSTIQVQSVRIVFQVLLDIGSTTGNPVAFLLSFSGPPFKFVGSLYEDNIIGLNWTMNPELENWMILMPSLQPGVQISSSILLTKLMPGLPDLPNSIPSEVTQAFLEITSSKISVSGTIVRAPSTNDTVPTITFDSLKIMASYSLATSSSGAQSADSSSYSASLEAFVSLHPRSALYQSTQFDLAVSYDSVSGWDFKVAAHDLNFAALYSLFDKGTGDRVMDFMEGMSIPSLEIDYSFDSGSGANKFVLSGALQLGLLELDMLYVNDASVPETKTWSINAHLGSSNGIAVPLSSIISSVLGANTELLTILPDFVKSVSFAPAVGSFGGFDTSPVQLEVSENGGYTTFLVRIILTTSMSITFGQITPVVTPGRSTTPTTGASTKSATDTPADASPKRILRFTMDGFPSVKSIPLIPELPQPFDRMEYVWVQDKNLTKPGLTRGEITQLNSLNPSNNQIVFNDIYANPAKSTGPAESTTPRVTTDDVLITAGHHFMVVSNESVVLDYQFGSQAEQPPTTSDKSSVPPPSSGTSTDVTTSKPPVAMAAVHRSLGPLSIANLGLQYKNGVLWLILDASIMLGPIEFALLGFGVGFDLTGLSLDKIVSYFEDPANVLKALSVQLNGLSLEFNQPPVLVAGVFQKAIDAERYSGGITLTMEPYIFMAIGAYEEVPTAQGTYKSVFVFAKLDGPLVSLGFADIGQVKLGFGYNSVVRLPTIDQVYQFPFVSDAAVTATQGPMEILASMNQWITTQDGPLWITAGMRVLAFQVLAISAAAIFSFGPSLTIAIIADAVARMPPDAPQEACFLNVELGIICFVDFGKGIFQAQAQLTPNSFIFHPSCHLTGGFALYYWFEGSEYAGDWVFTIGGYHKAYTPPDHYPKPPRLEISWNLDDCLSVTGEAYFAVTPKVAMGGGYLKVVFNAGPLEADFEAWADFLVIFKPFFFMGDVGVSISVSFSMDIGFCTISIGVSIGADMHLHGPPFGGIVHVDFYVFGFDIRFGVQNIPNDPLPIEEFYTLVRDTGPAQTPPLKDGQSELAFSLQSGAVASSSKSESTPGQIWAVRAGTFKFRIACPFALTSKKSAAPPDPAVTVIPAVTVYGYAINADAKVEDGTTLCSIPMHVDQPLASTLSVTIVPSSYIVPQPTPGQKPAPVPSNIPAMPQDSLSPYLAVPYMKAGPVALWGKYSVDADPNLGDATSLLDPNAPTMQVMGGIDIASPYPILSQDRIPYFSAKDAMNEDIFGADHPILAPTPPEQTAWKPQAPLDTSTQTAAEEAWTTVQKQWQAQQTPSANAELKAIIQTWTTFLGWDVPTPDEVAKLGKGVPKPMLSEASPTILTTGLDVYYLALPAVAASA